MVTYDRLLGAPIYQVPLQQSPANSKSSFIISNSNEIKNCFSEDDGFELTGAILNLPEHREGKHRFQNYDGKRCHQGFKFVCHVTSAAVSSRTREGLGWILGRTESGRR